MAEELLITVALCGAETTREHNLAVPFTPAEIAAEARRSFDAGARMAHVHARWDDGTPTQDADRYVATVAAIREAAPELIVQVSTGGAVGMTPEERLGSLAAAPEMATLTCGTVNFGKGVFENPAGLMLEFARAQLAAGIKPELEIFDLGHLDNARWLIAKAPLEGSQHYDLVLGVPGGAAGTPQNVVTFADRLPPGSTWSATGIGNAHLPVIMTAIACGGHVRVGFEDQVELRPGELAGSNADFVARAAEIGRICRPRHPDPAARPGAPRAVVASGVQLERPAGVAQQLGDLAPRARGRTPRRTGRPREPLRRPQRDQALALAAEPLGLRAWQHRQRRPRSAARRRFGSRPWPRGSKRRWPRRRRRASAMRPISIIGRPPRSRSSMARASAVAVS